MSSILTDYEQGMQRLLTHLGKDHPEYREALIYQARLKENIERTHSYGDDHTRASERAQLVDSLNRFAIHTTAKSFNEFCELDVAPKPNYTHSHMQGAPHNNVAIDQRDTALPNGPMHTSSLQNVLMLYRNKLVDFDEQFERIGLRNFTEPHIKRLEADLREIILDIRHAPDEVLSTWMKSRMLVVGSLRDACDGLNQSLDEVENEKKKRSPRYYKSLRACQEHINQAIQYWESS